MVGEWLVNGQQVEVGWAAGLWRVSVIGLSVQHDGVHER